MLLVIRRSHVWQTDAAVELQLLFLYFGCRMLKEGMESHGGPSEELTEVRMLFTWEYLFSFAF